MNTRILVMDDEPELLDLYREILVPATPSRGNLALAPKLQPYELVVARTGEEALSLIQTSLRAGTPLVGGFFDMRVGQGIDGVETIRRAKDIDPEILCVIVTGHTDRRIEE